MTLRRERSRALFARARQVIPGGVNSPVRAFRAVGGDPLFIASARGATLTDVDGNTFIDYVGTWGPAILGHAPPDVVDAVTRAAHDGFSFGAPTEGEVVLAELLREFMPSLDMVRLVSSGTEACMSAIRLARAFTGRDKVVKFDGCYHGHADGLLVKAGSGVATLGLPDSPGVPASYAAETLVVPCGDLGAVDQALAQHEGAVAAVIIEPVVGNMGVVPPAAGFLEGLRQRCDGRGTLLIFDEVMTGFRVGPGGAQDLYGVRPDLTCLGKIAGGGMPLAAYGGRRDVMDLVAPAGPMYQAGTLSGNPVAVAAGIATLTRLKAEGAAGYGKLEATTREICDGIVEVGRKAGVSICGNRVGAMATVFFAAGPVDDVAATRRSDTRRFARFHGAMLEEGVYLPPSQFEAWFVSLAHGPQEVTATLDAARRAFSCLD